jgi:glutamate--cysteine ligase
MVKIPNLKTALQTPLSDLEQAILDNQHKIEHWFREKWLLHDIPFYGSVDLRNSGYKLAPVDMNLFPGGFNNIHSEFIPLAAQIINTLIGKYCPHATKVLLIPENHTRNIAYLKNVYTLNFILEQAGIETRIGSLSEEISSPTTIEVSDGVSMVYYPLKRVANRVMTSDGFDPCVVLLNNDLSAGRPAILEQIEQVLLPPLNAGWYMRKKTHFFNIYDQVCNEFASLFKIDSWLINPFFTQSDGLDFSESSGLDKLANSVAQILAKTANKYQQYGIKDTPYVIVKANSGTYGMGIMSIKSPDEIMAINRKSRNKMAVIKDGQAVSDVIVQEGVYTIEQINKHTAEPVIYMMGSSVVGGFYRVNAKKAADENLNSNGASFAPMSIACECFSANSKQKSYLNRFYIYSVIARLSLLASSIEIKTYI